MTTIDVAALRALMGKATKGEWEHLGEMFPGEVYATTRDSAGAMKSLEMVCEFSNAWRENVLESAANMALIAAMKRDFPALLDAYEEREKLRRSLLLIQQPVYGPMSDELLDSLTEAKAVVRAFLREPDAT